MSFIAVLILVMLIIAIRISDKIENIARDGKRKGIPTYSNFFSAAFGRAGRHSAETLKLRSTLRALLLLIGILMGTMALSAVVFAR